MTRNNQIKKKMVKGKKERGLKIHIYFSCRFALWSFFSFGSQPKDKKVVKTKQLREDKYRGEKKIQIRITPKQTK